MPSSTPSQTPSALPSSTPSANPSQGCENTRTDVSAPCFHIPYLIQNTSLHVLIPACSLSAVWIWNIQSMDGKTSSTTTSNLHHTSIFLTLMFCFRIIHSLQCRCDCPAGICLDANEQCYTTCEETINTNPWAGCIPGWDCPWFPDAESG